MKKIVIVGANSALAKAVIPVLAANNTIITAGKKGCDIRCDVTKPFTLPKADVIINFAAAFGGTSDAEIVTAYQVNALGVLNVCRAGKKAGVAHVINISSIFTLLDEDSPYYSVYALTKKQGDELAQYYCRLNKLPLTVLRPSQIYGDSDDFAKHQPFFYEIIDRAQKGQDILIYGKNDARKNYIHCADLAEIIKRTIDKRVEGVYPCASPADVAFGQIARTAQKVFGNGGTVTFLKNKPDSPDNVFAKDAALYKKLQYQPRISLEAGIKRIKSFREGAHQ